MPDKGTKHIPRPQLPVGAVKGGKVKVKDGDTGSVTWRSGRKGMLRDWDGDAISTRYNKKDAKVKSTHKVHRGKRPKKDVHHPGESSWKDNG